MATRRNKKQRIVRARSRFMLLRCEPLEPRLPLTVQIVADLNTALEPLKLEGPPVQVGNLSFFAADQTAPTDEVFKNIWRTDGTATGTFLVTSIVHVTELDELTNVNGKLFFCI